MSLQQHHARAEANQLLSNAKHEIAMHRGGGSGFGVTAFWWLVLFALVMWGTFSVGKSSSSGPPQPAYTAGVAYPGTALPTGTTVGLAYGRFYGLGSSDDARLVLIATAKAIYVGTGERTAPMTAFAVKHRSQCLGRDDPVTGPAKPVLASTSTFRRGAGVCVRVMLAPTSLRGTERVDLLVSVPGPDTGGVLPVRLEYAAYG